MMPPDWNGPAVWVLGATLPITLLLRIRSFIGQT